MLAFVAGLLAGMTLPLRYGLERMAGFARALLARLPHEPPPGREAEEALQAAVEEGQDSPGDQPESDATNRERTDWRTTVEGLERKLVSKHKQDGTQVVDAVETGGVSTNSSQSERENSGYCVRPLYHCTGVSARGG